MILLRIAVVAVVLALAGPVHAETCDTDPVCRAYRDAHCITAACELRLYNRCARQGVWRGCRDKAERRAFCEARCAPAIAVECSGVAKCRRRKLKGCMIAGELTSQCPATTTTTATAPTTTRIATTTTHFSTTTTTRFDPTGAFGDFVGTAAAPGDRCGTGGSIDSPIQVRSFVDVSIGSYLAMGQVNENGLNVQVNYTDVDRCRWRISLIAQWDASLFGHGTLAVQRLSCGTCTTAYAGVIDLNY